MGRSIGQAVTFEDLKWYADNNVFPKKYNFTENSRVLARKTDIESRLSIKPLNGDIGRAVKSEELITGYTEPQYTLTIEERNIEGTTYGLYATIGVALQRTIYFEWSAISTINGGDSQSVGGEWSIPAGQIDLRLLMWSTDDEYIHSYSITELTPR